MQTIGISPKGSYKLSDTFILEGSLTLKNKYHFYDNSDRDSRYYDIYAGLRQILPTTGSMLTYGLTLGKDMENNNDNAAGRTDVSNSFQKYSVSLYHPLKEGLDLTAAISGTKVKYPETDVSFLENEDSFTMSYSLGLMKSIDKKSMVTLNGSYMDSKSNIENKVYNKKGLSVSYIYNF